MTSNFYKLKNVIPNINRSFITSIQSRLSSYYSSPTIQEVGDIKVKYSITSSPEDWKYVERTLPPLIVPKPYMKNSYSTEWRPQSKECMKYNYFIERTRNHMIPVYLLILYHGTKRVTKLKNIKGDIWALEKDLLEFLQKQTPITIQSQVHEFAGFIRFRGDHVNAIKYWLTQRKF